MPVIPCNCGNKELYRFSVGNSPFIYSLIFLTPAYLAKKRNEGMQIHNAFLLDVSHFIYGFIYGKTTNGLMQMVLMVKLSQTIK